ncbi:MAG: ASCH domain-containing protein [Dehalococcoidales bacterium]|nr:ASCH domain-containing protein [Dehalococcoidales bacterium]
MKALSFRDPWGWLVASGLKDVDNRNWSTKFRGRIYIHISKTFDWYGLDWIMANLDLPLLARNTLFGIEWDTMPRGAIIGEVDIIDCVTESDSPWFVGKFGFLLANARLYETKVPCRGKLGFFQPEIDFLKAGKV